MDMNNKRFAGWLLSFLLTASSISFGQATASSTLQGTVTDRSGAAIVGAEVTVINAATGLTRTVKTGTDGGYRVDPLPVGIYNVRVAMRGFSTQTATKVETMVGSSTTQNFGLTVGAATETVEVTAEAPLIDQLKTDVSTNITPKEVQELPLIGRDVADLAFLAPGVKQADSYDPTKNRYAILSVNGQGGRNVNVLVNGVDNKDNTVGGPVMQLPLEAVQEFQISTQRFSAQNGRSEGAAINLITKSGSNNYHGSLFGFFRDQKFNADQVLAPDTSNPKGAHENPPYSRQFYGGSVGGPFIKDKLFGFFGYEHQREITSIAEDSSALTELQAATSIGAQPASTIPRPFYETRYNGRLDYTINSRNTAYLSYSSQGNNSLNDQSDGTGDLSNGNFTTNQLQLANLTVNSTISNTLVNTLTLGEQYWNNVINSNISKPLVVFPSASFGTNTNVPQQSFQRKWQFKDDVAKAFGKHNLKFGEDYIYNPTLGGYFEFSSTLEVDFAQDPTAILANPTKYPQGFATPGLVSGMTIANGDPATNVPGGTKQLGLYFQDDWKLSPRLTLNLGLRWDKDFNFVGGSAVHNSRTYQEMVAIAGISPLAKQFTFKQASDDNKDFSPRLGFAYDLTGAGKHVLRGGYGLYYGDVFQNIPIFMEQQHNPTIFQTVFSLASGDTVPGTNILVKNYRYGVDPLPTIPPPSAQLADGSVGRLIDPVYRNPVTEEWNAGYSWEVAPAAVIEVDYTHVLSLHENKTVNINPTLPINNDPTQGYVRPLKAAFVAAGLPVLSSVRDEQSIGRSRYDGLSFSYRQRLSHHFSMNSNYTLSRALSYDGGSGSFRNYPRDPRFPFAKAEFGPTPNDELHHLTISGLLELPFGLQFSPIVQAGSARPYENQLTSGFDTIGVGTGSQRAVVVPNGNPTAYQTFADPSTATAAAVCYFSGNCQIAKYDALRGDPFFQMDARIAKNIKLGEQRNLQLAFQAFNLTNHANYGNNFHTNISASNFGTAQGFINPTSTIIPRSFEGEFGARFTF
jgi:outer membrane receptor protein involved in Fe transport